MKYSFLFIIYSYVCFCLSWETGLRQIQMSKCFIFNHFVLKEWHALAVMTPLYLRTSLLRDLESRRNTAKSRTKEDLSLLTPADTCVHSMAFLSPDPHNWHKVNTTSAVRTMQIKMVLFYMVRRCREVYENCVMRSVFEIHSIFFLLDFGFRHHAEINWCGFGSLFNVTLWLRASTSDRVSSD